MNILVAIANYGNGNRLHLERLLDSYRQMPVNVSIVVLSNIPKDLGPDIEVRVGMPSSNPWSLPFAHRELFRERLNDFDFFIYSEDDTLVSWRALKAFIDSIGTLRDNEIAGFVRTEESPTGDLYYSSCHSFFRWIPSTVCERGGKLWVKYSNEHSACFVASREQIRHAINSGGFTAIPHEGRHDMLCAAATDIYTQCGLNRLVCIDQIPEFSLPHLPNKYIGKMGLPAKELNWQVEALHRVHAGKFSDKELLNPETRLPGCVGSKPYREQPSAQFEALLDDDRKRVLVWGAGDGVFEAALLKCGHDVSVVPLDAVMGELCRRRGLKVILPVSENEKKVRPEFDAVILRDTLHLVEDPAGLLSQLRSFVTPGGEILVRVPNFNEIRMLKRRWRNPRFKLPWVREYLGATPFSSHTLKSLIEQADFSQAVVQADVPERRRLANRMTLGLISEFLSPYLYLRAQVRPQS